MDPNVTLVSAYYIMKSKFTVSKYETWIKNFMTIKSNKLIFTDSNSIKHIKKYDTCNTQYIILDINDFLVSKYDSQWPLHHQMDHEKNHSIDLYKIWAEKSNFLLHAINKNLYNTDYFVWCDIGCFRNPKRMKEFQYWPQSKNIKNIVFLQLKDFTKNEKQNIYTLDERFRKEVRIGGGIIAGNIKNIKKWHTLYYNNMDEFFKHNIFAGKDQNIYGFTILQNPDLITLVKPPKNYKYDVWFYLEDYLN